MMNGAMPGADCECLPNRLVDISFCQYGSPFHLDAAREVRRDGCGESAARAMRMTRADASAAELSEFLAVVKKVNRWPAPVPPFDNDTSSAHRQDSARGLAHMHLGRHPHARQLFGFRKIRGDDGRQGNETRL